LSSLPPKIGGVSRDAHDLSLDTLGSFQPGQEFTGL
jgi:hypothetical protein